MMYIGIDDTDSKKGMCTTYIGALLARELSIMGLPRLVRLNPNIPYKTRGNAAICMRTDSVDPIPKVKEIVFENCMSGLRTNPGIVALECEKVPKIIRDFYFRACSEHVNLEDAYEIINKTGAQSFHLGNGRGLIGALASIGYLGVSTYEMIAYRKSKNYCKPRKISQESVYSMDSLFYPETFDNISLNKKRILIMPNGPDPILYAIRGTNKKSVQDAASMIKALEPVSMVQCFETNQASDDHIVEKNISQLKPYDCASIRIEVTESPRIIPGGHLIFKATDKTGSIDCAAYKKSGTLRDNLLHLLPGDILNIYGGMGKHINTFNIEKVYIISAIKKQTPDIPVCCGRKMTSDGRKSGYKCRICSKKNRKTKSKLISRQLSKGIYDADPGSRRHLSRPKFLDEYKSKK